GTNAAAMQAAVEAAKNNDPAVGYGVAYPLGLVGAILCMYFMQLLVKPNLESVFNSGLHTLEVAVHTSGVAGRPLGDCLSRLPEDIQVLLVRAGDENKFPSPELILGEGDVLFLGGKDKTALESARDLLGQSVVGKITGDRSKIDYVSAFVSRPDLVGTRLSDLKMPKGVEARVMHIQRGDNDMLPTAGITLEAGDRVGVLTDRSNFQLMRRFFGNSMRGTTEFSYICLGIGIMLGVCVGIMPLPIPGLGTMKLGVAGGALIVALILGKLGRTWNLTWTMPMSANLTLRNAGLSIFLAQVGMSSGAPFVKVVHDSGVVLLGLGACILLALALTP
ncbi:MAG TPA: TrkA C-terminal domain-containing protein, partial [Candidatus Bathyarchaeia archaeon]|nr:TrkA C-terminal domain-containing protein [Candidatus Bathyarchaeia archaeon]